MTSVFAIRALHASRILEEIATKSTTHDVVELLLHEFMSVHFMHLFLARTESTLTLKPKVEWTLVSVIFD
jgi:hypothetical protein